MSAHFLRDLVRQPASPWAIRNLSTGAFVATHVVPAFDRQSRNLGLLSRAGLSAGDALVLAPCWSVHTWFMRFPIDLLFVSRSGEVLKVKPGVAPWRIAARPGAFAVIELCEGGGRGIAAGDRVGVDALEPEIQAIPAESHLPRNRNGSDAGQKLQPRLSS